MAIAGRRAERRRIARTAKELRPAAYDDARALCATVGPERLAAGYGLASDAPLKEIAEAYVKVAYRKQVQKNATAGALAGFADWTGKHETTDFVA